MRKPINTRWCENEERMIAGTIAFVWAIGVLGTRLILRKCKRLTDARKMVLTAIF